MDGARPADEVRRHGGGSGLGDCRPGQSRSRRSAASLAGAGKSSLQAEAWGDLDARSAAILRKLADRRAGGGAAVISTTLASIDLSSRGARVLAPGTVLGREHAGVMHHVMVVQHGYAWNGTTYRSLSEVAFAITGTRWNGRRFFALDKTEARTGKGKIR